MAATVDAQGRASTPIFLLWSQSLYLPFQHQLPLHHVEGRDKLALQAGGQDKSPPVTPFEWHSACTRPPPRERQEEAAPWEGRVSLGKGKERSGECLHCTEEDQSPWSAPCGKLGGNHVQVGPSNKTQNLTVR